MKKYLFALFISFSTLSFSQIWQNDFSISSDWISTDLNVGTDTWLINSTAIGGDVDTINSLSAGNGFAQFNSLGQCSGNHQDVTLTYYQPIDISANEFSYVEFVQHYKRKKDSLFIEFSNDGLTWESIRINKEYWFYQQTENPDTVKVSIPSSVQSAPFWMRFRYSGECGYAWLIDDVKIYEKQQYKANVESTVLVKGLEYHKANNCVMDTLDFNVRIENFGYDTLYNVIVEYKVVDNVTFTQTTFETISQINPFQIIDSTFSMVVTAYAFSTDYYQFATKIYSTLLDTIFVNNLLDVTTDKLRRDNSIIEGTLIISDEIYGAGQIFIVTEDEEYCSSNNKVFIPANNLGGNLAYAAWFRLVNGIWIYHGQSEDFNIINSSTGYWQDFSGSYLYNSHDTGLVAIVAYGLDIPIAYAQQLNNDNVYFINDLFYPVPAPEGHALLIQLYTNYLSYCHCYIGIDENIDLEILIVPNPATNQIQFDNLSEPITQIFIYSPAGRLVYSETNPSNNSIELSTLSSGMYLIQIKTTSDKIYFGRFIKE